MVTRQEIDRQLKAIGANFTWWGRGEARELEHVLEPGETIMYCINGRYEGGFAMLCVTDQRSILIDKKPFYLTLEDIRYDMISEVDFDGRLLDSTITINTVSKVMRFTTIRGDKLRQATAYLQRRITEIRQYHAAPAPTRFGDYIEIPTNQVRSLEHRIINPYTRVPLVMRRRVSRFYQ